MKMVERKAYTAFGETGFGAMGFGEMGFGETGRHPYRLQIVPEMGVVTSPILNF